MAVVLYKDGESIRINHKSLHGHLALGWSLTRDSVKTEEKPVFDEIDTNDSGKLSVDEIRQAAKEAGIEGWETKRIKTLKKELNIGD